MHRIFLITCLVLFAVEVVVAEDTDETEVESPTVEIEASEYREENTTTASRTIIDADELAGNRLDEALERQAGLRVIRRGGAASYSTLSIRGSNANQVRVYLDGIPLNNAVAGEVNLGDLNPQLLDKVEIHRSGSANSLSGSAIGGSVNLELGADDQKSVFVRGGSFNTIELGGTFADTFENWNYAAGVSGEKSDQNYLFQNDNGTRIFNPFDDRDERRKNAQFERLSATGKVGFQVSSTDVTVLNDYYWKNEGIPGPGNNQTEKTERHHWRNTTGISTDTKGFMLDRLRLGSTAYYTELNDHFFDPRQEFQFQAPNSKARLQQYGVELSPTVYIPEYWQTLRISATTGREAFRRDRRNRFDTRLSKEPTRFRTHSGFHIEDEFSFLNEKLIITPGFRYNRYLDRFNEPRNIRNFLEEDEKLTETNDYSLGLRAAVTDWLVLRILGSRDTRVPLFTELFGERGLVVPNTSLRPEIARSYEAGFDFHFNWKFMQSLDSKWKLSITGFDRNVEDLILFVPNSPFSLRAENVDAATIRGFEVSARVDLNEMVFLYSNYTYQKALNESEILYLQGNYLALRPLHSYSGGAGIDYNNFETGFDALFTGANFRDRSNDYLSYQPARWIYDLYFQYTILKSKKEQEKDNPLLVFRIDIKNVLNERVEDIVGFPVPGRGVYASLRYYF